MRRAQALIFVRCDSNSTATGAVPPAKGSSEAGAILDYYVFVHPICEGMNPIVLLQPVTSPTCVNPPPNSTFEVVEVWFEIWRKRLYVDEHNLDVVRRLFPEDANIEYITKFRIVLEKLICTTQQNLMSIEKLLASGASVRYRHPQGGTLAHFAMERGLVSLMKVLQKCGYNLDTVRNDGLSPLHAAVKKKDSEMVKTLAESGADVNAPKEGNWTPLHTASDVGDVTMIELLLENGASIDAKATDGKGLHDATPLHVATKKKRWDAAKTLIENGASLDAVCNDSQNALYFAVYDCNLDFVKYLLGRALDVNAAGNRNAFCLAFRKDGWYSGQIIQEMIQHGFLVGQAEVTVPDVLFGAIRRNSYEIVQDLLERGADVHQKHTFLDLSMTPIHVACRCADEKMVQLLLDNGADPGAQRGVGKLNTPIADAVQSRQTGIVELLLKKGITVFDRYDLLHFPVTHSNQDLLELMLANGCPIEPRKPNPVWWSGNDDEKPLRAALNQCHIRCVDTLMKYGKSFQFQDVFFERQHFGSYPHWGFLLSFLAYGFVDVQGEEEAKVKKLLIDCDARDYSTDDDSCQHNAITYEMKECGRILAEHLMKLRAAGRTVGDVIPSSFVREHDLVNFHQNCYGEIQSLNRKIVPQTNITFVDLLFRNLNCLARYLRNESVRCFLQDYQFEEEFPKYASIIQCRVRQGNWRREFLDKGLKSFALLVRRLPALPYELKEYIVGLLGNQDIQALHLCFPPK